MEIQRLMGQSEIIKLLEKQTDWVTTNKIINTLDENRGTISRALGVLHKNNEILKRTRKIKLTKWNNNKSYISFTIHNEYKINEPTEE